jgi:hypothetical protein
MVFRPRKHAHWSSCPPGNFRFESFLQPGNSQTGNNSFHINSFLLRWGFQALLPHPMNTRKTILISFCLISSLMLSAQQKDPQTDLPYSNKIELNNTALESLFQARGAISTDIAPGFHLVGNIQNRTDHGNGVLSLLIQVESQPGGMLSITRYKDGNGHIFYSGRLLKLHDPDGMMLVEKEHRYYFIETQQRFLVSE